MASVFSSFGFQRVRGAAVHACQEGAGRALRVAADAGRQAGWPVALVVQLSTSGRSSHDGYRAAPRRGARAPGQTYQKRLYGFDHS